ncbi:MAG: response regulator [Candidatus Omnitrophica bacterium]|nr:response regulator [Candidatus Omnitrophota bacterium]
MSGKKILIIDDELYLFELLKERLEFNGYEVMQLDTGANAQAVIMEKKPDLIILDIMLPDNNGYDICYEIKHTEETASIPVIIFTAKEDWKKRIEEMCQYVKADDYVAKPFEPQELLDKIKRLIKE